MTETTRLLDDIDTVLPDEVQEYGFRQSEPTMGGQAHAEAAYANAKKLPQYIAALAATLGALACGTVLGWTSPVEEELENGGFGFPITKSEYGWVGSLTCLGAALMCYPVGLVMNRIGRKYAMLALTAPFMLGWLMIIFSDSLALLLAGRFFLGVGGGAFCICAPLYTTEISQTEIRGTLGSFFQLMVTVGILLTYLLGRWMTAQHLAIVCGVLPLVFFGCFFLMPETPYYLLKRNRSDDARKALKFLRGRTYNPDGEMRDLSQQLDKEARTTVNLVQSFAKRQTKMALLISLSLMFFQQMSGINAVIFYTSQIFADANVQINPKDAAIMVGVMQVLATLVSSMVIDRAGRRILLLISDAVMAICTLLLGIFFSLKRSLSTDEITDIGFLPILSLCLFIIAFSLGYGPIPWMIAAEVTPSEVMSFVGPVAGVTNWMLAFIVTKFYNDLAEAVGTDTTFYVFTVISVLGTVFVWFVVPETKGKSLDEIQRILSGGRRGEAAGIGNKAFVED